MGYYEYDTGYYEPSEFEELCEQLKETLKKSAWKDLIDKIKELESEIETLKPYKEQKNEVERVKRECERKVQESQKNAKEMRIKELFHDNFLTGYMAQSKNERGEKCDKCDKNRKVTFISPLGREMKEDCACATYKTTYHVAETEVVRFYIINNGKGVERYFKRIYSWYNDGQEEGEYDRVSQVYKGEAFDTKTYWDSVVFLDKDDCQRCCDYLNKKLCSN